MEGGWIEGTPRNPQHCCHGNDARVMRSASPQRTVKPSWLCANSPFMAQEIFIHIFPHQHLAVHIHQKLLGLLAAHLLHLGFKGADVKLLFQGKINGLGHGNLQTTNDVYCGSRQPVTKELLAILQNLTNP